MLNKKINDFNNRILIIDDEESVRDNFKIVLGKAEDDGDSELSDALQELTGIEQSGQKEDEKFIPDFELDFATNGKRGYELVKNSIEEGRP